MRVALCLYGYYNSLTDLSSNGDDGYVYIKKNIIDKCEDIDIFIHNWQPHYQEKLINLYKPKKYIIEEQFDFSITTKENKITIEDLGLDKSLFGNLSTGLSKQGGSGLVGPERVLSHFYSKCKSITLANEYENENNIIYDWVIVARFDTGRINRETSKPGTQNPWPVQCINFSPNYINKKFYTAYWNLFNEGPADMWFYSNSYNMKIFSNLYDYTIKYLQKNSEYSLSVMYGWPDSSYGNFRSNELFKEEKDKDRNLHKYRPHEIINAILLQKWFLIKTGLWYNMDAIKTKWE